MKDRTVLLGVRRPDARSRDSLWPRPFLAPEPELEGVADELRQLYAMYSDHDEVPDHLAELARRAADAYEAFPGDTTASGDGQAQDDRMSDAVSPDPAGKRH